MARTREGVDLTRQHRSRQMSLRAGTLRDVVDLWQLVDPVDLAGTIGRFAGAASVLVRARHRDSAGLASRYFADFRNAEGMPDRMRPRLADPPPPEVATAQVRGAGLSGIIAARRSGFSPQAAARNGLVKVSGAVASLVLRGSRDTVVDSVQRDDQAFGWQRATADEPCAFCRMVASRGAVFKSEATASFEAHDHCSCEPEPFYEGSTMLPRALDFRGEWDEAQQQAMDAGELSRGTDNDALNAFRRYLTQQ